MVGLETAIADPSHIFGTSRADKTDCDAKTPDHALSGHAVIG